MATNTAFAVTVPITVKEERILDILTSALEGGSNYWYNFDRPAVKIINEVRPSDGKTPFVDRLWSALKEGKEVIVSDLEDKGHSGLLSLVRIINGFKLMARQQPSHFADFLSENDDAITADVFFQFTCFGELIYG